MAVSTLVLIVAVYAAVATAYVEARRRREAAPRWARIAGPLAVGAHFTALVLLSKEIGRSPFGGAAESLTFLAFALGANYVLLERTSKVESHGGPFYWMCALLAACAVPGLVDGVAAATAAEPGDALRTWHIGLGLLSTTSVFASGLLAGGYLNAYRRVKQGDIRQGTHGPALSGFQRLARTGSLTAAGLLLPTLVIGVYIAMQDDQPAGLPILTLFVGALFVLLTTAWLIWWRRPLRGRAAAWINIAGALLVIVAVAIVHPIVIGAGS